MTTQSDHDRVAALETIAVIDIGKTSAKLVLLDAVRGHELDARSIANEVLLDGLYPHANVERLYRFIIETLKAFATAHPVSAISITTHGATAALMADDELALPVLDYEHSAPDAIRSRYAEVRPDFAETLTPALPAGLNLGAQIFWQAMTLPDEFARVTAILTYAQYWAFRLTGQLASEVTSLGCHTDLWAPVPNHFSSLVQKMGWETLFPPLKRADQIIGTVTPEVAAGTGLRPGTPVATGIHDSNASLVPHLRGATAPFNVISSGTWTIHMHVGGATDWLDPHRDSLANVDYLGRPVPTARFMGGREFAVLAGETSDTPSSADIQYVIDHDIMALPSFTPGVGPFAHRKGKLLGAAEQLSPGKKVALASLYLALNSTVALGICGTGTRIIVEGPLARNQLYLGVLRYLTGIPVNASDDATGTSLGAAMLFNNVGKSIAFDDKSYKSVDPVSLSGLTSYAERWRQLAENPPP